MSSELYTHMAAVGVKKHQRCRPSCNALYKLTLLTYLFC